jgi:hypothetical protein
MSASSLATSLRIVWSTWMICSSVSEIFLCPGRWWRQLAALAFEPRRVALERSDSGRDQVPAEEIAHALELASMNSRDLLTLAADCSCSRAPPPELGHAPAQRAFVHPALAAAARTAGARW